MNETTKQINELTETVIHMRAEVDALNIRLEDSIKNLDETIESYKKKLDENKALIKKISDYANELPEIISKQKAKVEFYTKQFEQAKADLIPYFDKLKNYFNSRGIKVIR